MKDRNVEFPQRYRLQKVGGTDDIYDIIPAPGDVADEGTLINKNTLLKDATADLFGLGTDAVPDDALRVIGRFHKNLANEYLFALETGAIVTGAEMVKTLDIDAAVYAYGNSVSLVDGKVVIDNEVELQAWEYGGSAEKNQTLFNLLKDKYFRVSNSGDTPNTVYRFYSATSSDTYTANATVAVMSVETSYTYYNSPDPNEFPTSEGYLNLGRVGEGARIANGSYNGTGTYGASNKCTLTFNFEPIMLAVYLPDGGSNGWNDYNHDGFIVFKGMTRAYGFHNSSSYYNNISFDGKTVSWYTTRDSGSYQANASGYTYHYVAFG